MLNFLVFLEKCINSYFLGANCIPCLLAHWSNSWWTLSSFLQLSSVDWEYARRLVSSENPIPNRPSFGRLQISCSVAVYSRNRIGERGEPCGTPISILDNRVSCPWITIVVCRFETNA